MIPCKCANPAKFIRFIYNRVILENEVVRAASIAALAKFGTVPALTDSILTLLQRSMVDEDDEVRDRATFYFHILKLKLRFQNVFIKNAITAISIFSSEK